MKKNILSFIAMVLAVTAYAHVPNDSSVYQSDSARNSNVGVNIMKYGDPNANSGMSGRTNMQSDSMNTNTGSMNNGSSGSKNASSKTSGNTNSNMKNNQDWKDGTYHYNNGKLVQKANGSMSDVSKDVKFKNGSTLNSSGLLKMKDGKTTQLKNGDWIDADGNLIKKAGM